MRQVTLEVPDDLLTLWGSAEALADEARQALVMEAVRRRRISAGKAAQLLGISLWDVHELMAKHDVPFIDLTPEELQEELRTADRLFGRGSDSC